MEVIFDETSDVIPDVIRLQESECCDQILIPTIRFTWVALFKMNQTGSEMNDGRYKEGDASISDPRGRFRGT